MSEKNHGRIQPKVRETTPAPFIPRVFQGKFLIEYGDIERNERTYGIHKMRALRDVNVYGTVVRAGDTFQVAGNVGCRLARQRDAEFADGRVKEEAEIVARYEELHQPPKLDPATYPKPEKAKAWDKGMVPA